MLLPDISQLLSMSSSTSGFGGLFGAQGTGQSGLFGGLFGGATGEGGVEGGLFGDVLSSVLGDVDLTGALTESLAPAGLQSGEDVDAEAEAELAILQVTQIVTVVYEEFTLLSSNGVNFDDMNSTEALSAAYQELGMSAEEADSRAARLTIMFMLLDNRISTADLIGGLNTGQIGVKQQRAFIQIEQTIQAFSAASIGSSSQLSALLDEGKGLLSSEALSLDLASLEEGDINLEDLNISGLNDQDNSAIAESLFGRVSEIFSRLADRAAENPEGKALASQLRDIANATQRISDDVVADGGLKLEQNIEVPSVQSANEAAVDAQIAEEQAIPEVSKGRHGKHADAQASERAQEVANDNANLGRGREANRTEQPTSNNLGRPSPLPEPATPAFVVRPAADGGVEVVDPQTGEIIQSSQGLPSNASSANSADAPMAQSRGLETAQQVRLAQQVRVHVRTLAAHNGGQIVVNLNPKELGRVQVRLEIEEGTVKGAITVQRPDVAESIAKDMRSLEQALQDVGLKFAEEGIAIQVENHSAGGSNSQESEGKQQTGTGFANTSGEALSVGLEESEGAGRWMNPDRLLDVEA